MCCAANPNPNSHPNPNPDPNPDPNPNPDPDPNPNSKVLRGLGYGARWLIVCRVYFIIFGKQYVSSQYAVLSTQ